MGRILSITLRGLAAVKAAFTGSGTLIEPLPASRMVTYLPEPVSRSVSKRRSIYPPPAPIPDQGGPGQSNPIPDKPNADDLELQRICEAIGLDVREVTGEPTPPVAVPRESYDLRNEVSDDVLKLIEHVEAVNPSPAFPSNTEKHLERATSFAAGNRIRSSRAANREAAQTPISRESELADVLASLKLRLLKIRLEAHDMAEAEAEIATAIAQLLSPRPKPQIIAISLQTLLSILEKAGPAALTKDVEASLTSLRAFLSQLKA